MAEEKSGLLRVFVKISPETKRRLTHLSVDAGANSLEEFAGEMLARTVETAWATFDVKRPASKRKGGG